MARHVLHSNPNKEVCILCCSSYSDRNYGEGDEGEFRSDRFRSRLILSKFYREVLFCCGGDSDKNDKSGGGGGGRDDDMADDEEGGQLDPPPEKKQKRRPGRPKKTDSKMSTSKRPTSLSRGSSSDLLDAFSVCSECTALVKNVTDSGEKLQEVEIRVRGHQLEILRELNELHGRLEEFQGGMKRIEGIVKQSKKREPASRKFGTGHVFRIRERIPSVVHSLASFNDRVSNHNRLLPSNTTSHPKNVPKKMPLLEKASGEENNAGEVTTAPPSIITKKLIIKLVDIRPKIPIKEERSESGEEDLDKDDDMDMDDPLGSDYDDNHDMDYSDPDRNEPESTETEEASKKKPEKTRRGEQDLKSAGADTVQPKSRSRLGGVPGRKLGSRTTTSINFDFTGMSDWRKKIVARVLAYGGKGRTLSERIEDDPRYKYKLEYDKEKGCLFVGDITDLSIHEEEKCLSCSKCSYRATELRSSDKVEINLFNHILGSHLNALHCSACDKRFTHIRSYFYHMDSHDPARAEAYKCDICHFVVRQKARLGQHKLLHLPRNERKEAERKLKNMGGKRKGRLPQSNIYTRGFGKSKDFDFAGISPWRRKLLIRVLDFGGRGKAYLTEDDPRTKYNLEYDREKGCLFVGDITDLSINDQEKFLGCSQCSYRTSEDRPRDKVDQKLFNHVLGSHLNALVCQSCDQRFTNIKSLLKHRRSHMEPEKFSCHICHRVFRNNFYIKTHMLTHMTKRQRAELLKADNQPKKENETGGTLSSSLPTQEEISLFTKTAAGIDFTGMSPWRRKIVTRVIDFGGRKNEIRKYENDPRDKFKMEYDQEKGCLFIGAITDLAIHDEEKALACSQCPYRVAEKAYRNPHCKINAVLFNHVLSHHLHAFTCPVCRDEFGTLKKYYAHMETHKKRMLECGKCGKVFRSRTEKSQHMKKDHFDNRYRKSACPTCGKLLCYSYLQEHKRRCTGGLRQKQTKEERQAKIRARRRRLKEEREKKEQHDQEEGFECELCAKYITFKYKTQRFLQQHMWRVHGIGSEPGPE